MVYPENYTNDDFNNLRTSLMRNPNITDVTATSQMPDRLLNRDIHTGMFSMKVEPSYRSFFDLPMIHGHWFGANDRDSLVVNEMGRKLMAGNSNRVIGVIGNLANQLNIPQRPLRINLEPFIKYNFLYIRVLDIDIQKTVKTFSERFGNRERKANVYFMNKKFGEWLDYQRRLNLLSGILAFISIILTCLTVYGISLTLVRSKIKQIALHKLFGATVFDLLILLVKYFFRQIVIAVFIFGPVTWLLIRGFLNRYVYATHFLITDILLPVSWCLIIVIMICGFHAQRHNRINLSSVLYNNM